MDYFPDLIVEKINWYKWKGNIRTVNQDDFFNWKNTTNFRNGFQLDISLIETQVNNTSRGRIFLSLKKHNYDIVYTIICLSDNLGGCNYCRRY